MARNAEIRQLLEKKLRVKQAQLYKIAEGVANSLSVPTSDAILVLAAKNHINLHKHGFPAAKLEEIRKLLPYAPTALPVVPVTPKSHDGKRSGPRPKKAFRVKLENPEDDPILAKTTLAEMEAMVPVYRTLYQLENSIRQFIARVLKAKHGKDWWEKVAPTGTRETVEKRTAEDQVNAWHQKRSNSPIDYLDLNQLPAVVRAAQADFVTSFFPTLEWFQQFIDEVYRSRCVVCHMNPLDQGNVDAVGVRFNQWEKLVKGKSADVERLEAPAASAAKPVSLVVA